jgi:hypothetical protein
LNLFCEHVLLSGLKPTLSEAKFPGAI